jgi:hypothetical protein
MFRLYRGLLEGVSTLLSQERVTRRRNLTQLMVGIYMSGSVHLSRIASKVPSTAKLTSITKRLSRFVSNKEVDAQDWYRPVAKGLVEHLVASGSELRLMSDGTKVSGSKQLLMVSIAYRRRALPLWWCWIPHRKGRSSTAKQLALLREVYALIPQEAKVSLVGDSEFGDVAVLQHLDLWGWRYALRQKGWYDYQDSSGWWQKLQDAVSEGQSKNLGTVRLTHKHAYGTRLIAHWPRGYEQPWLLATNYPTKHATLAAYAKRMWTEEMFGDFKGNGFDLESTRLSDEARLSRLTLAVCLLYVWLVALGSATLKRGQRHLVDRNDRRDLSIFRIGLYMLDRHLRLGQSVTMPLLTCL